MWLFSFDRDETVNVGETPGPIPLEWVQHLVKNTEHIVWVHGNQALKAECGGAPGYVELERQSGKSHLTKTDTLDQYATHPNWREVDRARARFLQILMELAPDAARYITTDNINLSYLEAEDWEFYYPQDFVKEFAYLFEK